MLRHRWQKCSDFLQIFVLQRREGRGSVWNLATFRLRQEDFIPDLSGIFFLKSDDVSIDTFSKNIYDTNQFAAMAELVDT